jgi:hypothetical protein
MTTIAKLDSTAARIAGWIHTIPLDAPEILRAAYPHLDAAITDGLVDEAGDHYENAARLRNDADYWLWRLYDVHGGTREYGDQMADDEHAQGDAAVAKFVATYGGLLVQVAA